ncbi:hypothetical protein Tco_0946685 [Tanacetum coccineum]
MLKQSGCSWNDIDKKIACERDWYVSYCKNHKDAQGLWDFEFLYFNQLEVVYGRDRATGLVAEGYEDAIHNLEVEQNAENRDENLGDFFLTLSDEENDVQYMSQATQTASNLNNATKCHTPRRGLDGIRVQRHGDERAGMVVVSAAAEPRDCDDDGVSGGKVAASAEPRWR